MNKNLALKKALTLSMALLFTLYCKAEDKNKGTKQKMGLIYLWQSQICAGNNPFPNGGSVTSTVSVSPATGTDYNYGYLNAGGTDYLINKKTIQKISSTGALSDFVGSTSSTASTDGTGTSASFVSISSVTSDSSGNIYLIDIISNQQSLALRKITPAGVVTTLATYTVSGSNGIMVFVTVDGSDNIYTLNRNTYTNAVSIQKAAASTLSFSAYYSNSSLEVYDSSSYAGYAFFADGKGNLYMKTSTGLQVLNSSLQLSAPSFQKSFTYTSRFLKFDSSGNAYYYGTVNSQSGLVKADSSGNTTLLMRAVSAVGMACNTPGYASYLGISIKSTGEIQGYGQPVSGYNYIPDASKYYLYTYKQP